MPNYRTTLDAYEQAYQRYKQLPSRAHLDAWLEQTHALHLALLLPGRFPLGQVLTTPGALDAMDAGEHIPPEFLLRHKHGDWGDLDAHDRRVNAEALRLGHRLLSVYATRVGERLWVITEADRSETTLLLPGEY
ncbi:MAG: hypothetical protein ACRDJW_01340 [Thermomicrobiales bacterium]